MHIALLRLTRPALKHRAVTLDFYALLFSLYAASFVKVQVGMRKVGKGREDRVEAEIRVDAVHVHVRSILLCVLWYCRSVCIHALLNLIWRSLYSCLHCYVWLSERVEVTALRELFFWEI